MTLISPDPGYQNSEAKVPIYFHCCKAVAALPKSTGRPANLQALALGPRANIGARPAARPPGSANLVAARLAGED